jgi:uncharacterized protein YecE (DUF72 family)
MQKTKIWIGTSGWYYDHWDKVFYPEGTKPDERLELFAENFNTVEVNNTFYRLPRESTVEAWFSKVPNNFVFSIKASQYITHIKRLKDPEESLERFYSILKHLKGKLGPILFQLPPFFKKDTERLKTFVEHLKKGHQHVFEFRHPSWYDEETYAILRKNEVALCITDLKGHLSPEEVTSSFTYIRLHGPTIKAYQGSYGSKELHSWRDRIEHWKKQKIDVYCYFDNDEKSYAVKNAKELIGML